MLGATITKEGKLKTLRPHFFGGLLQARESDSGSTVWVWADGEIFRGLPFPRTSEMAIDPATRYCARLHSFEDEAGDIAWMVHAQGTLAAPRLMPTGVYSRSLQESHYSGPVGVIWDYEGWPRIEQKARSLGWKP